MDEEKLTVTLEKGEDVYDIEYVEALVEENERLIKALQNVFLCGHNDDCLLCARKDTIAKEAVEELLNQMGVE